MSMTKRDSKYNKDVIQKLALDAYMAQAVYTPYRVLLQNVENDFNNFPDNVRNNFSTPEEMQDFIKVLQFGIDKGYEPDNWLLPNGKRCSEKDMHDSMFHHLAESFIKGKDKESGLDPLLHLACRALMLYTRRQKGIVHDEDKI